MKVACILSLAIGFAMLIPGTGYAVASNPASQPASNESSASRAGDAKNQTQATPSQKSHDSRHISDVRHPRSSSGLTNPNRSTQRRNDREQSAAVNAANIRAPGSAQSGTAKGILGQSESVSHAKPVHQPAVVRAGNAPLYNVRHLRPNPAVIGGTMNSPTRNTGAISGSRMNRWP
jgi:hypothetical protein